MKKTTPTFALVIMVFGFTLLSNRSTLAQTNSENISTIQKYETKKTLMLEVKGMTCQLGCADGLDKTFKKTKGILTSKTAYNNSSSEITYNPQLITEKEIISIIKNKGFSSTVISNKTCSQNCSKSCCIN